jgi:hypothetical protein
MKKSTKTLYVTIIFASIYTFLFVWVTHWMPGILFFPCIFLLHSLNVGKFVIEKNVRNGK